jgi:hypothetical protein
MVNVCQFSSRHIEEAETCKLRADRLICLPVMSEKQKLTGGKILSFVY